MYSVVCRKVHECRFTLAQLQRSIQRARHRLDHERVEITPEIMDKLLSEREQNDHKGKKYHFEKNQTMIVISFFLAPFIPQQPNDIFKSGDIYLKSIDKNHRRSYDKFIANDNSEGDNNNTKNIQQLYVRYQDYYFVRIIFFSSLD
jgi:hypothetical protein